MSQTTKKRSSSRRQPAGNGARPSEQPDQLAAAIAHEQQIADEAATIRDEHDGALDEIFLKLWPLLKKPIPEAFIVSTPSGPGKPYASTGVKSLQVLVDRMNNVLTPLGWGWSVEYFDEGKLAEATVWVGSRDRPLVERRSRGGVNQASTTGNLYKGSETNAAKRAFAAIGPGHEVYLGATDLDPDVSEDAAKEQERRGEQLQIDTISADEAAKLRDVFDQVAGDDVAGLTKKLKLKLGSMGVTARSVNQGLAQLTPAQAADVDGWLAEQKDGDE